MDEVGRGAIAGPVSVGVVLVSVATPTAPQGLRDSKLLTPDARERLAPLLERWAHAWSVGHASAREIDELGIMVALRLAGLRALAGCLAPCMVVLDGQHDWLSATQGTLFEPVRWPDVAVPPVETVVRGDRTCAAVAAASVLAKVVRDRIMTALGQEQPDFGWGVNKGYATRDHYAAIRSKGGLVDQHRRSWRLAYTGIDNHPDVEAVHSP